ncbi:TetR/AcrR family transcriptional regulator [Gordonia sp. SL306]|uniref:TetR/AcrR family transcriptional regulator n=1 Tax=Gordonia sp. SL306 TaxID=2995145 RepID=UPI00226FF4A6|nr:TetR/AcrR family transcriptional regulator [Gordonia sp. SL306]WAC55562.1 helix-turn-helix domain containing protein [Gordonia sp. SL306]
MARPRVHDHDHLLDVAEKLAVDVGPAAVTVRALSEATSVSNGAIYNAFGSRAGLVGRVWVRAARQFLALQRNTVNEALAGGSSRDMAVDAVVAAADTPALFLIEHPVSARFLLTVRRDELLGSSDIPADIAEELRTLDKTLGDLLIGLSRNLWDRVDRYAVAVIRDCVVELPTALLLRGKQTADHQARERLAAAVRAVLTIDPPPAKPSRQLRKDVP